MQRDSGIGEIGIVSKKVVCYTRKRYIHKENGREGGNAVGMIFVWLGLIVLAVVLEAITTQLVTIWFVFGAIAGLIAEGCGASIGMQILIAAVVTLIALLSTRPLAMRYLTKKRVETNAGRYVGQVGIVTEPIDNLSNVGQVKVMGSVWTARSENGELLPADLMVRVLRIEGVKIIVQPVQAGQTTN